MHKREDVGIIGGPGASEVLEIFIETGEVIVSGVLDSDENSGLIKLAGKAGIFATTDPCVFFKNPKLKTVLDMSEGWFKKFLAELDNDIEIVSPGVASLLFLCVKDRRRLLKTQSALERISEIAVSTFDIDRVLKLVVYIASRLLKVEKCSVRLLEQDGSLSMIASSGLSGNYLKKGCLKIGESVAGWVVKNKKPHVSSNLKEDRLYKFSSYAKEENISSLLCVPLMIKDRVMGSFSVYNSDPRRFAPSEMRLFSAFANQVAVVLENARLFKDVEDSYLGLLEALGIVVEARDFYTADHSKEVRRYAMAIATEMGLSQEELKAVDYTSTIHDLGKIGIEEKILSKPEKLTPDEFVRIADHSRIGADIISQIKILRHLAPLILHLHERYDGRGYPDGLKGEEIPLGSRILMVADAFSAMTSNRPYRKALPVSIAEKELQKHIGTQFDPGVVKTFVSILPGLKL